MAKPESHINNKTLKSWALRLATIVLSLVILLCSPLLATLLLPIYIFRYFISKLGPALHSDLSKIVSHRSACFAADDLYNRPLCTLICKYVVEGTLDTVRVKELLLTQILTAKSLDGTPKYEELTQYVSSWMGFAFWRNEKNFVLGEHVRSIEIEGAMTESQLTKYFNKLGLQAFEKEKSPWEMIIVPNMVRGGNDDGKPKSAVIIRVHHCMSDGYGLLLLGLLLSTPANDSDGISKYRQIKKHTSQSVRKSYIRWFCERLYFTLRNPYDIIKYNWELADPIASNSWHMPEKELEKLWTMATSEEHISSNYVKEIKNSYGVSFNAAIMAACAGSIRNFMLRNPAREVPDFISVGTPFPLPTHPGNLQNFFTIGMLKLPVGESCPVKRLMYVEKELQKLKKSPAPIAMFEVAMPAISCLFTALLRRLLKVTNVTAIISSMPGPSDPLYFLERRLLYIEFYSGLGAGNTGIALSALSYNGVIRIGASVEIGLISSGDDVQALVNGVHKELVSLKELSGEFQV